MKNSKWRDYQNNPAKLRELQKITGRKADPKAPANPVFDKLQETIFERALWVCRWCSAEQIAGHRCSECGMPRPVPEVE
jgi:hypothetical protein